MYANPWAELVWVKATMSRWREGILMEKIMGINAVVGCYYHDHKHTCWLNGYGNALKREAGANVRPLIVLRIVPDSVNEPP